MRPLFYLIDGYAVAYRQYFGLSAVSFTTRNGEPTNAVFGFTRLLLDILEKQKPKYLAVSFDMGLSGRETLYSEYKGTRDKMDGDLERQLPRIQEVVEAFNIPLLAKEGYEADDVIGTATLKAVEQGADVRIVTGDRDLLQLLNDHVTVQLPSFKGAEDEVYDVARFIEKFEIRPDQWVDAKALMGDTSDNIPGVQGIGKVTATKLLQQYGTLENIYANIDSIKGANQKKLIEGREMAFLSQKLALLQLDVPITFDLEKCVSHEYEQEPVLKVFEELEFRSHRDRVIRMNTPVTPKLISDDDLSDEAYDSGLDMDDPDYALMMDFAAPSAAHQIVETITVRDEEALQAMVETLKTASSIAFDTETTSTDQMLGELVGISLSVDGRRGYYIPVGHDDGRQLPRETVINALRPALTDPNIPKYGHNASYDMVVLQRYGIEVAPVTFDTMIAEWLVDPESKNLGLKNLVYSRLKDDSGKSIYMTPITDLIGTGKNQVTFAQVPIDQGAAYAAADAALTHRLVEVLQPQLEHGNLMKLFTDLEMPLVPVIAELERSGVVLDTKYLSDLSERLQKQLEGLEQEIYDLSGGYGKFNINSPKQLNDVLFVKLGLPTKGLRKTQHGYTTDAATLDTMLGAHPIIEKIMEYRELTKLKGTYIDALPALINPRTGRVHTSYNQTGTTTGRISSNSPNLQNIPIRTEIGREVRRAFIAPEGKQLVSVDYSQVELRIMAHITRDSTLVQAFNEGQDIHAATAAAVYGLPVESITKQQRNFAKRVNFGLLYGMSSFRLARESNLTLAEADAFVKTYFDRLPGVQQYINDTKRQAKEKEGLMTLMGRRRFFPTLMSGGNRQVVQAEERAAINMPIQGTSADIMKRAMIDIYNEMQRRKLETMMILQVHDELVFEAPEDEVETIKQMAVEIMERAYPLDPPLKANAQSGKNWRDMG